MADVTFSDRVYRSMIGHTLSGHSITVKEGWTPDAIIVECHSDPIRKPIWRIQRFVDGSLEITGTLDAAGNAALAEINAGVFHAMSWDEYDAYRTPATDMKETNMQSHRYEFNGVTSERVGYNGPNVLRHVRQQQFDVRVYQMRNKLWTVELWRKDANSYGLGLDWFEDFEDEAEARVYFEGTVTQVHDFMDTQQATKKGSRAMTTIAAALALFAALTVSPVTAHEETRRAPVIVNAGTADAAIRLPGGDVVQLEYIVTYATHRNDPAMTLFEDGSVRIEK